MTISVTKLRDTLKEVLLKVKAGQHIDITQHGQVIATIGPPKIEADELVQALETIRSSTVIVDDIVDAPLKEYDSLSEDFEHQIAAEPDDD